MPQQNRPLFEGAADSQGVPFYDCGENVMRVKLLELEVKKKKKKLWKTAQIKKKRSSKASACQPETLKRTVVWGRFSVCVCAAAYVCVCRAGIA